MIEFLNCDCMEYMKSLPDKAFDLAIVDPEYGIGRDGGETGKNWKWYEPKEWDKSRPERKYFEELFRVSENQIIWGGNYFTEFLPPTMGWVFWDKGQDLTMSDGELAFTSFDVALRRVVINRCKISEHGGNIHPTQKPVKLYRWLLQKYAKEGFNILDTHGGSMSNAIACDLEGFDLTIMEKDKDYFDAALKRFNQYKSQTKLFS